MARTPGRSSLAGLAALTLALGACGDDDSGSAEDQSQETAETIELESGAGNYEGTEEVSAGTIEFEEDDYYFEPTVLAGEAGQKVTLEITNEGDEEHNLTVPEQDVDEDTAAGDTASVDVEIPDEGVVEFFCRFHTAENMRGALAVTGSEPTPDQSGESATSESSRGAY